MGRILGRGARLAACPAAGVAALAARVFRAGLQAGSPARRQAQADGKIACGRRENWFHLLLHP